MLPNFLCVGFRKCGTTTLQDLLVSHPQIYLPDIKETLFFSIKSELKQGINYYEKKYYSIPEKKYKAVGGIEPSWLNSANNIQKYFPKSTKFIFIMRNPVDYSYSLWKMYIRQGQIRYSLTMPFNDPLTSFKIDIKEDIARKRNYLRGHYTLQEAKYIFFIHQFLKYYPKENMKFIIFEEFIKNKKKYIDEICEFIGVDTLPFIKETTYSNAGNTISKNKLANWIMFFIRQLEDWNICYLKRDGSQRSEIYKFLMEQLSTFTDQKLDKNTRKELEKFFAKSVRKLEMFLNKDLSKIWFDSRKYIY